MDGSRVGMPGGAVAYGTDYRLLAYLKARPGNRARLSPGALSMVCCSARSAARASLNRCERARWISVERVDSAGYLRDVRLTVAGAAARAYLAEPFHGLDADIEDLARAGDAILRLDMASPAISARDRRIISRLAEIQVPTERIAEAFGIPEGFVSHICSIHADRAA